MSDETKMMMIDVLSRLVEDNKLMIESRCSDEYYKHQLVGMNIQAMNCINLLKDESFLRDLYETL